MSFQIQDKANVIQQQKVREKLKDGMQEKIYFSTRLQKINKAKKKQERVLLVTDQALYSVQENSVKRRMLLSEVDGITISTKSSEFIVHIINNYDYRYDVAGYPSLIREEIIKYIAHVYHIRTSQNLKIYVAMEANLEQFTTNDNEFKKNMKKTKMPWWEPRLAPIKDSNLFFANIMLENPRHKVLVIQHDNIYKVWYTEFVQLKQINTGFFGPLYLVKYGGNYYAEKIVEPKMLGYQDLNEYTKLIQRSFKSIYTPDLQYAFQDDERFILMLQLMIGGDLYQHLKIRQVFSEEEAKFIFMNVVLALEYFHSQQIIYGDLKPENILIDDRGYIRLTDFGFPRHKPSGLLESCYTLDYLAPEIINGGHLSYSSDMWSLGCLLYEMLIGVPPFYHENEAYLIYLIKKNQIRYPGNCKLSQSSKDLISSLLVSDPEKRMTLADIFKHPWLNHENWDQIRTQQSKSAFELAIHSQYEINEKYFDIRQLPDKSFEIQNPAGNAHFGNN